MSFIDAQLHLTSHNLFDYTCTIDLEDYSALSKDLVIDGGLIPWASITKKLISELSIKEQESLLYKDAQKLYLQ